MNSNSSPRLGLGPRAFRHAVALGAVLILCLATPAPAATGAHVRLSRAVGPPTTRLTITGRGFGPTEVVDLSFDSYPEGTPTTDPSGSFSAKVSVPARALSGDHAITATGETSGLTASAPFTVRTDWPMFHFTPDHRGVNPYENVLSPSTVSGLQLAWSFAATRRFASSPAVAGGTVYAASENSLYAVDAATGARLWKWTGPYVGFIASPVVWHNTVYFGTDRGTLYALDAATGRIIWTKVVGWPALAVSNGVVYVGSIDGSVYAVDALTGGKLWGTHVGFSVFASAAVAGGVVYVATFDGSLYALDQATGAPLWSGATGGEIDSSPAVANGLVYVGSDDHNFYAFPAAGCGRPTCQPVWVDPGKGWQSSPAVAYGIVFVGVDAIYALGAATGALKWSVPISGGGESPALANGVVYAADGAGTLQAIDARSGTVLWSYPAGDITAPVVVNGWLYAASFDQHFYAFHLPG